MPWMPERRGFADQAQVIAEVLCAARLSILRYEIWRGRNRRQQADFTPHTKGSADLNGNGRHK